MHPSDKRRSPRTRSVVIATGILVLGLAPLGVAATGDALREGKRNGTTTRETEIVAKINASGGAKSGYATRQSNTSPSGGGAIYGCRSTGGSASTPAQEPCLRSNNLRSGYAFEFNTNAGETAGLITAGGGGDGKRPFVTNATGVATGLNADRVDGQDAAQIVATARAKAGLDADTVDGASASDLKTRWALIDEAGRIAEQSGGFTIIDAYQTNQNVYVDAGAPMAGHALTASIAIRNVNGSNFGGEVSVARCQVPGVVECAPPGAKNANAFVVSPRNSDGTATAAGARKRFYVQITE